LKQKAEQSYRMAITLNPNLYQAYSNLGFLYLDLGRKKEALEVFRISFGHHRNQPNVEQELQKRGLLQEVLTDNIQ